MSRLPRLALAFVLLTIALVFFASVLFPPKDERNTAAGDQVQYPLQADPGTTVELPGPLQIEDVFQRSDIEQAPAFHGFEIYVHAEDSLPLANATVLVYLQDGSRESPTVNSTTNAEGRLTVKWVPAGPYRLIVFEDQYFQPLPVDFEIPSPVQLHFDVALKLGAVIRGEVRSPQGEPVQHGTLRFSNPEMDYVIVANPDVAGNFHSGPLEGGLWKAEWVPFANAVADPNLQFEAALAPGNHRRLRFTVISNLSPPGSVNQVTEIFD